MNFCWCFKLLVLALVLHQFALCASVGPGKDRRPPLDFGSMGELKVLGTVTNKAALSCYYYNNTECKESMRKGTLKGCHNDTAVYRTCPKATDVCFGITGGGPEYEVKTAGCLIKELAQVNDQCIIDTTSRKGMKFYLCCCNQSYCNIPHTIRIGPQPLVNQTEPPPPMGSTEVSDEYEFGIKDCAIVVATLFVAILACVAGVCCWYRRKKGQGSGSGQEVITSLFKSEHEELPSLQLIEVKAQGRFGNVWKATLNDRSVAVKISALQDKQSWMTECDIYRLPGMEHDNLLHFIGAEQKGEDLNTDLWLVTDFHANGSLHDYLKGHALTWWDGLRVLHGMVKGLAHLHQEKTYGVECVKPSIAHRDFKSKNVLLKADLTPCLADFGLSLRLISNCTLGESHGQVGTCRYMAPEVLEGAIEFTKDSFLRIDMYACGLVMWEVLSRIESTSGCVAEYRLPFDLELGPHPRLDDMQEVVVNQKVRPTFNHGDGHKNMASLIDTIEECWDQDAEARLPAGCVVDRLDTLITELSPVTPGELCVVNNEHNKAIKERLDTEDTLTLIEKQPLIIDTNLS